MDKASNQMEFLRAKPADTGLLRALARKSEAHWGYDDTFMEAFDHSFNITESFILENPVYAAWEQDTPVAFWGLKKNARSWELEYFYVAEQSLNRGCGRQMWAHMAAWCMEQGIKSIHFVTSPQATGFYQKAGAVQDGTVHSVIDGRPIPHFVYQTDGCRLTHVRHTFEPVFDETSRILVLGSFPSVKSRENDFYYGHPQNRFWKLMARLLDEPVPDTIQEKKDMLLRHQIAVWDVIAACDIKGSSDSSIRNVTPADLNRILRAAPIKKIIANGSTAYALYKKYCEAQTGREAVKCPSTSPANAVFTLDRLAAVWEKEMIL